MWQCANCSMRQCGNEWNKDGLLDYIEKNEEEMRLCFLFVIL